MRKSKSREEGRGERAEGEARRQGLGYTENKNLPGASPKENLARFRPLSPLPSSLFPLLLLCACAMGPSKAAMSPAPAAREPMWQPDRAMVDESLPPEEQIAQLEAVIDGNLGEIGLGPLTALEYLPADGVSTSPELIITKNGNREKYNSEPNKNDVQASPEEEGKQPEKDKKESRPKDEEDHCVKVCTVIDSICDASERICQIAERMPPESDAPKRCERAQNACRQARSQGESCGCST